MSAYFTTTLTETDNNYTAPLGEGDVNALGGSDTLILDYSSATGPIRWEDRGFGWARYTDDAFNSLSFVNFENYRITGGSDADDLRGAGEADTLNGGGGNDRLSSGLGADVLDGGAGVDTWSVDYSSLGVDTAVTLLGAGATFTVEASGAKVKNVEALSVTTGIGDDFINTSVMSGNDNISTGEGDDEIRTGLGIDTINAGGGTDLLVLDYSKITEDISRSDLGFGWMRYQDATIDGPETRADFIGVDRFNITGGSGNDNLFGGGLNDALAGGAGNDTLNGSSGADTINGGLGTDVWGFDFSALTEDVKINISGATQTTNIGAKISNIEQLSGTTGAGDDSLVANAGVFNDSFTTGAGSDTIVTGLGVDYVQAGDGGDDLLVMNWGAATQPVAWSDQGFGWYRFNSGNGDQVDFYGVDRFNLTGGSGNDVLRSFGGADTLNGGAGNDTLLSSTGLANINGGAGADIWNADLSASSSPVIIDALLSQTVAQGTLAGLSILDVEGFQLTTGARNDSISTSYAINDDVSTGAGDDTVALGRGIDNTNGGDGTDTLIVNYSSAATPVGRTDLGFGWMRIGDQAGLNTTRYIGFEKFNLTGGNGNDVLVGGSSSDTLNGGVGNDVLNGGAGKDVITGGAGADRWIGDQSAATKTISFTLSAAGAATLVGVGTTVTGIESITLSTGAAADVIDMSAVRGNNVISTNAGNDRVTLGAGIHEVNDGAGSDLLTFNFSTSTTSIRQYDEGFGWWRFGDVTGVNSIRENGFEQFKITGGSGNDRITTWSADDILIGGAGNDVLAAGAGNDVVTGGTGNDIFYFGTSGNGVDRITDASAGDALRIDGASLTGSVTLGNGAAVGNGQVQLSVNTTTNVSTISIGTNATAGADVVINLTGAFETSAFTLSGRDILMASGSTNPGTPGNDSLIGTSGPDELSGGIGNDRLEGKAGNDLLNGGDNDDVLIGGFGADILTGGLGADLFVYQTIGDSTPGTVYRDVITDFSPTQLDKLDFSAMDANPVLAGNQAFEFSAGGFTGQSGQLTYSDGLLMADVNGDGFSDMEVLLTGSPSIGASSFKL